VLVCFVVVGVVELQWLLFDMLVVDFEIVFGLYIEYSGLWFVFFLLSEYVGIVVLLVLIVVLFFGGWYGLFSDIFGWLWILFKIGLVVVLVIWVCVVWLWLCED